MLPEPSTAPPPHNVASLIEHLRRHPDVSCTCTDPRIPSESLVYMKHSDGGLWWRRRDSSDRYTPIECGMAPSETGLLFHPRGFTVEKFGVTLSFIYLFPEGETDKAKAG